MRRMENENFWEFLKWKMKNEEFWKILKYFRFFLFWDFLKNFINMDFLNFFEKICVSLGNL